MIYDAVPHFCDEEQDMDTELIFYEPDGHNMIIKITYPTEYIEYSLNEEDQNQ